MQDEDSDKYLTINSLGESLYKDRSSKFYGYAYPIKDIAEVDFHLSDLKTLHPKSRHICFAYIIGHDDNQYRASDDGEPSGSAGLPILNQIKSHNLTNILIAVVRYFGGTKLGVPGLIAAYKDAASSALASTQVIEQYLTYSYRLKADYKIMGDLMHQIKKLEIDITDQRMENSLHLEIAMKRSTADHLLLKLKANMLNVSIEQVDSETEIPNLEIEKIE